MTSSLRVQQAEREPWLQSSPHSSILRDTKFGVALTVGHVSASLDNIQAADKWRLPLKESRIAVSKDQGPRNKGPRFAGCRSA